MNRRKFVGLMGMGITGGLSKPAFAGFFQANHTSQGRGLKKAYGSGHFGEWITDQFGLPAYRYTCDQLTDPRALSMTHKEFLAPNNHLHLVGNDRVCAVASNFGHVQVRQDEGSPKYLNDYLPEENRYGGGIGWLTDGSEVLSTYYHGGPEPMERVLGEGYLCKTARSKKYTVEQTIFAPYGDDPVLISFAKITNHGPETANLRWVEYWGCNNYQFSNGQNAADRRRLAERFEHEFQVTAGGRGLIEKQRFHGYTDGQKQIREKLKKPIPGASYEDLNPPATFLVSLDEPVETYATDAVAFFGGGGVLNPSGLKAKLANTLSARGSESAHLIERSFALQPKQSRTVAFLYGYLPEGFELDALIARYSDDPGAALERSSARWKTEGVRFSTAGEPWVEREVSWHNYYLRGALTYDSFFREHIISQGCVYQYVWGFQGAARDPLQHVLPFIFSDASIVKQVVRYTLKEIQPDGSLPYGIVGSSVPTLSDVVPSDQEMWLLWALSEYVLATRDTAFLKEKISLYGQPDSIWTVAELAGRMFRHLVDVIGVGEHGMLRFQTNDWNDALIGNEVPEAQRAEAREKGESSLNSAMACYVLAHYARLLSYVGDTKTAEEARAKAEAQQTALRAQWTGLWFRRAWLGPQRGWLGDKHLWLEPQPWAIISGAATDQQSAALVKSIDELVRKPSPIGAMILSAPNMSGRPGSMENGGVWPSINGTLIWALALEDGAMAWDEWKKNSLARHAEAYPDIWYGIWSGPDYFNSIFSDHPGETQYADPDSIYPKEHEDIEGVNWTDCPVMCQHQHAWPLYTAAKLLGLEFKERGLRLAPVLPVEEFEFKSSLLGMKKWKGGYTGWYEPSTAGTWEIEIHLPEAERSRISTIKVNDVTQLIQGRASSIRFQGESLPGRPLRWEFIRS